MAVIAVLTFFTQPGIAAASHIMMMGQFLQLRYFGPDRFARLVWSEHARAFGESAVGDRVDRENEACATICVFVTGPVGRFASPLTSAAHFGLGADMLTQHRYCPAIVRRAYVWMYAKITSVVARTQVTLRCWPAGQCTERLCRQSFPPRASSVSEPHASWCMCRQGTSRRRPSNAVHGTEAGQVLPSDGAQGPRSPPKGMRTLGSNTPFHVAVQSSSSPLPLRQSLNPWRTSAAYAVHAGVALPLGIVSELQVLIHHRAVAAYAGQLLRRQRSIVNGEPADLAMEQVGQLAWPCHGRAANLAVC